MPVDSRGRQLFILFFYQLAFLVPRLFCLSEFDQAKQTSAPMPYTHAISLNSPLVNHFTAFLFTLSISKTVIDLLF